MDLAKGMKLAVTAFGLALFVGCGSSGGGSGTGGSTGTGGSGNGTGGTTGTGGSHTGGTTGTGGTSTGGSPGTGGIVSTGGSPGTGGIVSTGGSPGTGGMAGSSGGGEGGHASGGAGGGGGAAGHAGGGSSGGGTSLGGSSGSGLTLTSNDQADGAHFNTKFTCAENPPASGQMTGKLNNGINPDLEWSNVPQGTMSFAITFLDTTLINMGGTNAMLGEHWAIWNIPASVMSFPEGTKTLSGDLANAKQTGSFLAPCAGSMNGTMGDAYEFTLYALSVASLNITGTGITGVANARTALMNAMTAGQVLGTAVLHGYAGLAGM